MDTYFNERDYKLLEKDLEMITRDDAFLLLKKYNKADNGVKLMKSIHIFTKSILSSPAGVWYLILPSRK